MRQAFWCQIRRTHGTVDQRAPSPSNTPSEVKLPRVRGVQKVTGACHLTAGLSSTPGSGLYGAVPDLDRPRCSFAFQREKKIIHWETG